MSLLLLGGLVVLLGVVTFLYLFYNVKQVESEMEGLNKRISDTNDRNDSLQLRISTRVGRLERGEHYILYRPDEDWGRSFLTGFNEDGKPNFDTNYDENALKFNLKRAKELKEQWGGVFIRDTMTGERPID